MYRVGGKIAKCMLFWGCGAVRGIKIHFWGLWKVFYKIRKNVVFFVDIWADFGGGKVDGSPKVDQK